MKFNLKNKPQLCEIPSDLIEHLKFESQIIEWFEGFEKELTAILSDAEFSETKSIKNDAIIELIKEILGETDK